MKNSVHKFLKLIFCIFFVSSLTSQDLGKIKLDPMKVITVVDRTGIPNNNEHPIAFAKRQLFNAIKSANGKIDSIGHWSQTDQEVFLILGTLENNLIKRLVSNELEITSTKPEGVFYQWREIENRKALIIGGTDAVGLMYALNEISQQIEDKGLVAIMNIENSIEFPENSIRGIDKFITDENDDSWFFSEEYWQYYSKQLALNRYNRITIITGYNDGKNEDFMIPVYPYLFKTPGFDDVRIKKKLSKTPEEYLAQLRRIGQISHAHGLEFVFGIWGHGRSNELITGLPADDTEYTKYCSAGMQKLLQEVPEIDGIHLRVNYESGVGGFGETAEKFWKEIIMAIGKSYKERNGNLFLDIRAKGLTQKMRDWALQTGINLHVTSKYTWEGVGLPYHPTQMRKGELTMLDNIDKRQRYGYADFLDKSRDFDFIYRLWGIGTMRLFTWADPDFAKRFSHTASFGGSRGFQVTPPLSRKQNTWNLFSNDSLIHYKWEDERYWAWHLLFGRLGYSTNCNPEIWQRAFRQHYGKSYKAILKAYSYSSKVLPLLTSSHLTYHPANYNWAEMDSGGALFSYNNANPYYKEKNRTYQSTEPGDPGLFYSIEEYVIDALNKTIKPKIDPIQLSEFYENLAKQILQALTEVKIEDIPEAYRIEYETNKIDLQIMATLAAYHASKIKAATDLVFFKETHKKGYLNSSLKNMKESVHQWQQIVSLTDKSYHQNPFFLHDNGTWNDRLKEIEKDIDQLHILIGDFKDETMKSQWSTKNGNALPINNFDAIVPITASSKENVYVTLITEKKLLNQQTPKIHYRIADMTKGEFSELPMKWDGTNFIASIPAKDLNSDYDLLIYFTSFNENGNVTMHPGLYHEKHESPYYVVNITN